MLAEAAAAALFALVALPPVLTDAATAALLASASLPPVLADAFATAVLADVALPPVRTGRHDSRGRARCIGKLYLPCFSRTTIVELNTDR